jgi:hypothetical protein
VAEQAEGLYLKIACVGRAIATSSLSSVYDDRMDAAKKTSTTGTYSTAMPFARSCTASTQYFVRRAHGSQTYMTAGVTHTAYERALRHVLRAHGRLSKLRITITPTIIRKVFVPHRWSALSNQRELPYLHTNRLGNVNPIQARLCVIVNSSHQAYILHSMCFRSGGNRAIPLLAPLHVDI